MTPQLLDVLRQFSHRDFRSGEAVARQLGISRASVHNAVREAGALGLTVQAVRGRGYRLAQAVSWLDGERLEAVLMPRGFQVCLVGALDSTNAHLLRAAQAEAPHKSLLLAEWQEKGRGRRGRTWLSGLGGGLTFSLLWRFERPAGALSGLSLLVGLVLAQVLRRRGLERAAVKWPNDILVDGAKLAGVLIELAGDMLGPSLAVIGIGLNVSGAAALGVEQAVDDIARHLGPIDRNALLLDIVLALEAALAQFEVSGFAPFCEAWQDLHAQQNQRVLVSTALGEHIEGSAVGVDEQGALLLLDETGLRRFHSGEVSLRRAP